MAPRVKSIAELRRELRAKEKALQALESRRSKLADELNAIDRQIAALVGATRRARASRLVPAGRPRRRATGKPLVEYVESVLKGSKDGMRVKDIVAAVVDAGYKSHSKDFYNIVAATVREESRFTRVGRGVYKLKS